MLLKFMLMRHQALDADATLCTNSAEVQYARFEQLDQDGTGDVQQVSGFLGRHFHSGHRIRLHPHGDSSTDFIKKSQYAVDYYQTSSYIHCYSTALDNFWPEERAQFSIEERSKQPQFQKVLFMVLGYVHSSIAYTIFGLGMERPQVFNELYSETLQSMAPYERRFS